MTLKPDVALSGEKSLGHPGGVEQGAGQVQSPHDEHVVKRSHVNGILEKSSIEMFTLDVSIEGSTRHPLQDFNWII